MPSDGLFALWELLGIAAIAIAVTVLWLRLRGRRAPLPLLRAFSMWARGLPAPIILEAEDLAARSGRAITLDTLVRTYERHRETVGNAQELLLAARKDAQLYRQ